jgi:hypothetical protein
VEKPDEGFRQVNGCKNTTNDTFVVFKRRVEAGDTTEGLVKGG